MMLRERVETVTVPKSAIIDFVRSSCPGVPGENAKINIKMDVNGNDVLVSWIDRVSSGVRTENGIERRIG